MSPRTLRLLAESSTYRARLLQIAVRKARAGETRAARHLVREAVRNFLARG